METTCDSSAKPVPPMRFLDVGGGTGSSLVAREIHSRLRQMFGWNVVWFVAPLWIVASNLAKGSTIDHALRLTVFDGESDMAQFEIDKAKLHRLCKSFEECKVLVVDEVSVVGCRMLQILTAAYVRSCNARRHHLVVFVYY